MHALKQDSLLLRRNLGGVLGFVRVFTIVPFAVSFAFISTSLAGLSVVAFARLVSHLQLFATPTNSETLHLLFVFKANSFSTFTTLSASISTLLASDSDSGLMLAPILSVTLLTNQPATFICKYEAIIPNTLFACLFHSTELLFLFASNNWGLYPFAVNLDLIWYSHSRTSIKHS